MSASLGMWTGRRPRRARAGGLRGAGLALSMVLAVGACAPDGGDRRATDDPRVATTTAPDASTTTAPEAVTVVATADVACEPSRRVAPDQCQHAATADLAAELDPAVVLLAGDLQYDRGELENFRASFAPTWGRFADRLRPVPGNHEYATRGAAGYFAHMAEIGVDVGQPDEGWYRARIGSWDLFALNSNCVAIGGCGEGSPQLTWLRAELASAPAACAMAMFHHPRFSSGLHGDSEAVTSLFAALDEGGVDILVSGHDHTYERFAPMTADGAPSPDGLRQFVAGTGGRSLYPIAMIRGFSEARSARHFGVLELTLQDGSYGWRFVALGGQVIDQGRAACR